VAIFDGSIEGLERELDLLLQDFSILWQIDEIDILAKLEEPFEILFSNASDSETRVH
jgi:hypothetical protein